MKSHPMFLRSIIHLGLVEEVRMHNGKNNPHYCMEENEERRVREQDAGQSGLLPPRGCGGGTPALLGQRGPWDLEDQDTSDSSLGSWQIVASPLSPQAARWVSPA